MFVVHVLCVLCDVATSYLYLTHYMASTTVNGVPTEEGCVSLGRLSRVRRETEMDELY